MSPPTFLSNYSLLATLLVVLPLTPSLRTAAEARGLTDGQEHFEEYLPDVSVTETWLFGAGDLSELNLAASAGTSAGSTSSYLAALGRIAPAPIDVPALLPGEYVSSASAGDLHAALLTNEGRVLTAGSAGGELRGMGRDAAAPGFRPVEEVYPLDDDSSPPAAAAAGSADGRSTHSPVALITSSLPKFVKVAASQYYTFAVDEAGDVWSTGDNAYGQLCLNDTASRDRFHQVRLPYDGDEDDHGSGKQNLFDRWNNKVIDVALGERHALLLTQDGRVFGCGWNAFGQLGIGRKGGSVKGPVEISIDAPDEERATLEDGSEGRKANYKVVKEIVAGRGSSYFLTESGHVYSTGTNYKGQLCLGHRDDRVLPSMLDPVENFLSSTGDDFSYLDEGVGVASIAAGSSSFYLLLSNGMLLACGENTQGQLGIGNGNGQTNGATSLAGGADAVAEPTPVADVANVTAIYSGPTSYGAYFVSDASVYAVGFDGAGLRGNWDVPSLLACADGGNAAVERDVSIATGNDVTLYLATAETTLACRGGIVVDGVTYTAAPTYRPSEEPTIEPTAEPTTMEPTMYPTRTMPPTATAAPTTSPAPTERPSVSRRPSWGPTATMPPTSSAAPTSNSTAEDTTYFPTLSPTPAPVDPSLARPTVRNGAVNGHSLFGSDPIHIWGISLVIMWQWL